MKVYYTKIDQMHKNACFEWLIANQKGTNGHGMLARINEVLSKSSLLAYQAYFPNIAWKPYSIAKTIT